MQKTLLVLAALCVSTAWGSTLDISKSCPGTGNPDVCSATGSIDGFGTYKLTLIADTEVGLTGPGSRSTSATLTATGYTLGPPRPGAIRLDKQLSGAIHGSVSMSIEGLKSCTGFEPGCKLGADGTNYAFELGVPFQIRISAGASVFTSFAQDVAGGADVKLIFSLYELGTNTSSPLYGGDPVTIFEQPDQQSPVPTPEPSPLGMTLLALILTARKAGCFRRAR